MALEQIAAEDKRILDYWKIVMRIVKEKMR